MICDEDLRSGVIEGIDGEVISSTGEVCLLRPEKSTESGPRRGDLTKIMHIGWP